MPRVIIMEVFGAAKAFCRTSFGGLSFRLTKIRDASFSSSVNPAAFTAGIQILSNGSVGNLKNEFERF